jgi:hypothetical protein
VHSSPKAKVPIKRRPTFCFQHTHTHTHTPTHDPGATIHISLNPSTKHFSNTNNLISCRFCCIIIRFYHIENPHTPLNIVIIFTHHSLSIIQLIIQFIIHFINRGQKCLTILVASHCRCLRSEFTFRPPHALTGLLSNQRQPTCHHLPPKESSDHTATMIRFLQSHPLQPR